MINQLTKLLFNKSNCPICNSKLNFNLSGIVQFVSTKENDYSEFIIVDCNEHYTLGFAKFINTTTCFFNERIDAPTFFLLKEHKLNIIFNESIIEVENELIFQCKIDLCITNYVSKIVDVAIGKVNYCGNNNHSGCELMAVKMMENFEYPSSLDKINKYLARYCKLQNIYS